MIQRSSVWWATALRMGSHGTLSKKLRMSRSTTQSSCQRRSRPTAPASSAQRPGPPPPFAPPALPGFIATTRRSAPVPRIGTLPLADRPLGGLPSARGRGPLLAPLAARERGTTSSLGDRRALAVDYASSREHGGRLSEARSLGAKRTA